MKTKESLFRSLAALVLAAAMLGASVCAYADEGGSRYEDVQPDDWFYDAVEHCAKYDSPLCLIEDPVHSRIDTHHYGKSSLFYPDRTFTFDPAVRDICMLHHVLSKMSDGYITPSNADKSDYIFYTGCYAPAFGLYDTFEGSRDYKTPITRAAFISLLYSAVPEELFPEELPETTIPDVDTDTDLGRMIAAFYAVGVLCGTDEDGTFDGDRAITRAEEAVIFSRVLQKLGF